MVGKSYLSVVVVALLLVGCSYLPNEIKVEHDYPGQAGDFQEIQTDKKPAAYSNNHKNESYNWPLKNTPDHLKKYNVGDIAEVEGNNGEKVVFAVLSEYSSAGNKLCKKYFINLDLHLACFNPHWYPVRQFEE